MFVGYNVKAYGLLYYKSVEKIANENEIDSYLVMAMIKAESSFSSSAISNKGAVGFMQILPSTAEWVCKINSIDYKEELLTDYKYNVDLGCKYLKYLLSKFELKWAIVAYNAGENNVSEWIAKNISFDEIPFKESNNYLKRVLANVEYYNAVFR